MMQRTEPAPRPEWLRDSIAWLRSEHPQTIAAIESDARAERATEQLVPPLNVEERRFVVNYVRQWWGDSYGHAMSEAGNDDVVAEDFADMQAALAAHGLTVARLTPQPSERNEPARPAADDSAEIDLMDGTGRSMKVRTEPARPADTALREALERLIAADARAETGEIGTDQEWDEAMEQARAALAAQPTSADTALPFINAIRNILREINETTTIHEMPHIPLNVEAALIAARDLIAAQPTSADTALQEALDLLEDAQPRGVRMHMAEWYKRRAALAASPAPEGPSDVVD